VKLLILSKKKGLAPLSEELERPLMEILWTKGLMKGRDLYEEIRREKDIAYTTALTVLDRLSKKGFVKKDRKSGTILFTPAVSRQAYESAVTESLVQKAFEVSPDLAASAFADIFSRMPKEDLNRLEKLIEEKKNGEHQG
jgi:predicted transcriptional regulator